MFKITTVLPIKNVVPNFTLTLPFEQRQKSRLRTKLDDGQEVGIILAHGQKLHHGDLLQSEDGSVIELRAAAEAVSTIYNASPLSKMRACYHLGNRHVALQINEQFIRFLQDRVLDKMIESLGMQIIHEFAPFEPEAGAYHQHE